ncbi:MAG TPA: glutaredoxin domain-containing protein [Solirubrobacteraceae bacterium]|jgi:glutaredoxin 3|nr:glutaredoxin domain-containing protein [Solirubrobacteraceae bacterium]
MKPITVYTTDHCPYCSSAKTLLTKRSIEYEEVNLARDPDGRAKLSELTGMITFPQIVIGGETLGGFQELLAADRAGRLSELLAV